jgi:ribonuclease HI
MAKSKQKFYVVWKGKQTGVFKSWKECQKAVKGFDGAKFKSFLSLSEAEKAFGENYKQHIGQKKKPKTLSPKQLTKIEEIDFNSVSVDAASSGNPGKMEYRGVVTRTRVEIFKKGPFQQGTNNIGEFLALVHACALLKQKNSKKAIYTDSRTALAWVRKKKCNTKLKPSEKNEDLFELVTRAENWLKKNTVQNKLIKWETKKWGEIPADFGRK